MSEQSELEKLKEENRRLRLLARIRTSDAHTVTTSAPPGGVVSAEQKAIVISGLEKRFGFIQDATTAEDRTKALDRYYAAIRSALEAQVLTTEEAEVYVGKVTA